MEIQSGEIWIAAGVLLGFQIAAAAARVNREITVRKEGQPTWLPPADILNLFSMVVLVSGIFILPLLGFGDPVFMRNAFGLAMLLFLGYPFALIGHYELFIPKIKGGQRYASRQELVVIAVATVLALGYVIVLAIS